ncbi:MAG: M16 family metallopeptidase [Bacteroidia bacterium]
MNIQYEHFTLDNGLRVLVHQDPSLPQAVVNVLYRVGSKDEDPNRTGFAHLFEHLMFRGSKHVPNYDTHVQRVGGQNNAFTHFDITNYYISLPANQIETAFWLESDRMLGLDFTEENLEAEKSVVIEEYKQRYLSQPYGDAYIKMLPVHFQTHSYQWPVIGKDISHIEEASMQDVKDFFFGFYAPNNASLTVAGDVTLEQVKHLAEKWFGPIPSRKLKKKKLPTEPQQREHRQLEVLAKVPFAAVYNMFHIPPHSDRNYYIADIITDILSSGRNARLTRSLVRDRQLATQVNAFSWAMHDPGVLSIDGFVMQGKTPEAYQAALREELDDLQNLTEAELKRVQRKLAASFTLQQAKLQNKTFALAFSDALGNPDLANTTPEIYQSITLEEVKQSAAILLAESNSTTLFYLPE